MIGRILGRSFWSWWDNLSYSLVTSLIGSMNPSFLVLVPTVAFVITTDVTFVQQHWGFWIVMICTTIGGMWLWPLSVVSHVMHERMIDGPVVEYFKTLWKMVKEWFFPSLGWWIGGTISGGLLGLSLVFSLEQVRVFPLFWSLVVLFALWFLVVLMMMQMVLVVLLYKSGLKPQEMLVLALYTVARHGVVYFVMLVISWVVYAFLFVPATNPITLVIPLVTVYGIGPVLHVWTFRYVFEEALPAEKKRSLLELFTPFVQLWQSVKRFFQGGK
ncbi:hypothetical protein [Thermospira aquatica]|uniref:DUF624 domain-containing protein n=1 Tax=Thermospira aquatica TaxID=2828656 RepID=A0AAX3BCX7_9SPIR|nr:hypothetical protein [Thermospira aquatica]URA10031.1 hypothetical protein KDW03_11195 [Thermospira aquatica]